MSQKFLVRADSIPPKKIGALGPHLLGRDGTLDPLETCPSPCYHAKLVTEILWTKSGNFPQNGTTGALPP